MRDFALFGLLALASLASVAETVLHYREGQRVDPQEVRQILAAPEPGRTRSIRLLADDPVPPPTAATATPTALSLPVRFAFDSAEILPEAREQLDALAEGIRLLPAERRVRIEGHTDATGSEAYNLALAQRRAAAVKQYLVQTHRIDPRRLSETGVGEHQPIPGSDPYAPENRRVEFRGQ